MRVRRSPLPLGARPQRVWCVAVGVLAVLLGAISSKSAPAQSSDMPERCTADVMRWCSQFVPEADRIVGCLKDKRRQLSRPCLRELVASRGAQKKRRRARR